MKKVLMASILKNSLLIDNIYEMIISAKEIANEAKAGQFVQLYTGQSDMLLPRPISICEIDRNQGTLRLIYQNVGKGTAFFSNLKVDDEIKVMGPLGNGFTIDNGTYANHVVVGGGIGVPPLLQLAKELKGNVSVFIGARSNPILVKEFEELGAKVYVATDDGSVGFKGNAVELVKSISPDMDVIYSCGPKIMLKFVAKLAQEHNIKSQVSMEERMACGIGACVGCAIKIKNTNDGNWTHLKVCKDGPVFFGDEVIWDE